LESALSLAAASFLENTTQVSGHSVTLSSLLLWYGSDFGSTQQAALRSVASMLPAESAKRVALTRLLDEVEGRAVDWVSAVWNAVVGRVLPAFLPRGRVDVRFAPYDWTLNSL
jgi:hypothetical protein